MDTLKIKKNKLYHAVEQAKPLMTLRGLDGRRADSKADLERDDKSPTRCKIAPLSWKSLEAVSVCRQIRTQAPLLVTHCRRRLWRQSHTKDPFTAAEAGIPFQHRCHLSRRATDAPRQAWSYRGPAARRASGGRGLQEEAVKRSSLLS